MPDQHHADGANRIRPREMARALGNFFGRRLASFVRGTAGFLGIDRRGRESWGSMLEQAAAKYPDNPAIKSESGTLSYREYNRRVNQVAHTLLSKGLTKGDPVVVFMENRPELLIVYSAVAKAGGINSMINTNLTGDSLQHCMNLNPGKFFVVGEELLDSFQQIHRQLPDVPVFFVPDGGAGQTPAGMIDLLESSRQAPADNPASTREVKPGDTVAYVFTSGTTGGMPKAAVITHKRVISSRYFVGQAVMGMRSSDTMYVPLPFFHTNAMALSWPTVLANGSALAIRRKFSVRHFLDDVRKYNATAFCYVGECCRYLMNHPEQPDDHDNPLTKIIGVGLRPDIWKAFKKRFGVKQVFEIYSAAESNLLFVNLLNLDCTVGMCFTPYAIVKYDPETGEPLRNSKGKLERVAPGETGLVLSKITKLSPFAGYTSKQATESKLFYDGFSKGDVWFNCGDLLTYMGFWQARFVDRLGDTFRWKGENVSTTEVEKVANSFGQISESAVYGVVMPDSDGRAGMASVIANTEIESFDFSGLAGLFQRALPAYAQPKFVRFMSEFDTTATHKIKKSALKQEGFDPGKTADPLYVLLPGESTYRPLTAQIYADIQAGRYKF